ncbi:RNA-binding S4 domain-containing protein [Thalassotalea atypica]|uniref:RNA-binding S4 domain-containing protein n=1 Tax=Thalassotalea atypica TaxID=2054316 RepID=UPI00257453AC|nr:RNA-binding S4 domain-containing protein [Thalassotalea atypica]
MQQMIIVEVDTQPIELCKLLKIANLVGGGGEAKMVISEGYVGVNHEVELQKRKKIYHNDIVEFNGEIIQLQVVESAENIERQDKNNTVEEKRPQSQKQKKPSAENKPKAKQKLKTGSNELSVTKRKPISF